MSLLVGSRSGTVNVGPGRSSVVSPVVGRRLCRCLAPGPGCARGCRAGPRPARGTGPAPARPPAPSGGPRRRPRRRQRHPSRCSARISSRDGRSRSGCSVTSWRSSSAASRGAAQREEHLRALLTGCDVRLLQTKCLALGDVDGQPCPGRSAPQRECLVVRRQPAAVLEGARPRQRGGKAVGVDVDPASGRAGSRRRCARCACPPGRARDGPGRRWCAGPRAHRRGGPRPTRRRRAGRR